MLSLKSVLSSDSRSNSPAKYIRSTAGMSTPGTVKFMITRARAGDGDVDVDVDFDRMDDRQVCGQGGLLAVYYDNDNDNEPYTPLCVLTP